MVAELLIQQIESAWGIKVPDRDLGRKNRSTEEILHGNEKESRQEKETLSERMLVQKFPKASREKHLSGGFSVAGSGLLSRLHEKQLSGAGQPC